MAPEGKDIYNNSAARLRNQGNTSVKTGIKPSAGNTAAINIKAEPSNPGISLLDFTPENILQGIIFSEILGRPKCRRRGRW